MRETGLSRRRESRGPFFHVRAADVKATPGTVGPACAGRAHRRCLLDSASCTCPCHVGIAIDDEPTQLGYRCSDCAEAFTTSIDRADHWMAAHQQPLPGDMGGDEGGDDRREVRACRSAESGKSVRRGRPVP